MVPDFNKRFHILELRSYHGQTIYTSNDKDSAVSWAKARAGVSKLTIEVEDRYSNKIIYNSLRDGR